MATVLDSLVTRLGFKTDASGVDEFESRMQSITNTVENAGAKMRKIGTIGLGVGTAVLGAGAAAVKAYGSFEKELIKIEGLAGVPRDMVKQWSKDIKVLVRETAQAPAQLAAALYELASAGLRGSDAIDTLRITAQASQAGLGDQAVLAKVATQAMNAYGIENLNATQAMDQMIAAVRSGQLVPDELAGAMATVLPFASQMGVEFKEVLGLMAAFSRTGTSAQQGAQQVKGSLRLLLKPSATTKNIIEELGMSLSDLRKIVSEQGLFVALRTLYEAMEGNDEMLARAFSNANAFQTILQTMGDNAATTEEILAGMEETTGLTVNAFKLMNEGVSDRWEDAMANVKNAIVDVGEVLTPHAKKLADYVTNAAQAFSDLDPAVKGLAGPVVLGAAGVTVLSGALYTLGRILTPVWKIMKFVWKLLGGKGLGGLIGRFFLWIGVVRGISEVLDENWQKVKEWVDNLDFLPQWAKDIVMDVLQAFRSFKILFPENWKLIPDAWQADLERFKGLWDQVVGMFKNDLGIIKDFWARTFGGTTTETVNVGFQQLTYDQEHKNFVQRWAEDVDRAVAEWWTGLTETITTWFSGMYESGQGLIGAFIDGIANKAHELWGKVEEIWQGIRDRLPFSDARIGPLSDLTESGRSFVRTFARGISEAAGELPATVSAALAGIAQPLPVGPAPAQLGEYRQQPQGANTYTFTFGDTYIEAKGMNPEEVKRVILDLDRERRRAIIEEFDTRRQA